MQRGSGIRTLQVLDTEFNADTVEWCPVYSYHHILACGTYQLLPQEEEDVPPIRKGRLHLWRYQQEAKTSHLTEIQTIDMSAILDIKWCHVAVSGKVLMGLAASNGELQVHTLSPEQEGSVSLQVINNKKVSAGLVLSLDWSTGRMDSSDVKVVCSDSTGSVSVFSLHQTHLSPVTHLRAHDYEAWISAFSYWDTNLVYSGGDDCKLKGWDLRMDSSTPTFTSKRHSMGVCSIHSNPHREHILATGSYDEKVLLWDGRSMRAPVSESTLGGGVWRLKWHPSHHHLLLAACMHNHIHVLNTQHSTEAAGGACPVVASYVLHNSLAYGADWSQLPVGEPAPPAPSPTLSKPADGHLKIQYESPTGSLDTCLEDHSGRYVPEDLGAAASAGEVVGRHGNTSSFLLASCSFYDHVLHLWRWDYLADGTC
ncbi:diphthine methyltransferase isoform X2 [Nerophis ophidion]|uniref:diphthine methyltransferase isoform X2 n=1 Tax=Nerophis ophidion TaxID=159077 RepID=UPI002ADF371D|nr:diphthine methyltransferase isoform X2 [Nerophis ophidion]